MDKDVRVGPDGVFVADRKVADLGQVVENIARTDVAEIKAGGAPTGRKRLGLWAALPGALAGALIGAAIEGDCRSDHPCDKGVIVGAPIGAIAGGVLGYRMSSHKTEGVIYYAP